MNDENPWVYAPEVVVECGARVEVHLPDDEVEPFPLRVVDFFHDEPVFKISAELTAADLLALAHALAVWLHPTASPQEFAQASTGARVQVLPPEES